MKSISPINIFLILITIIIMFMIIVLMMMELGLLFGWSGRCPAPGSTVSMAEHTNQLTIIVTTLDG